MKTSFENSRNWIVENFNVCYSICKVEDLWFKCLAEDERRTVFRTSRSKETEDKKKSKGGFFTNIIDPEFSKKEPIQPDFEVCE